MARDAAAIAKDAVRWVCGHRRNVQLIEKSTFQPVGCKASTTTPENTFSNNSKPDWCIPKQAEKMNEN